MVAIELREASLAEEVNRVASNEGKDVGDVLAEAVRQYLDLYREKRIRAEAKTWYEMPAKTRNQYKGCFVAVYNGEIIILFTIIHHCLRLIIQLAMEDRVNDTQSLSGHPESGCQPGCAARTARD